MRKTRYEKKKLSYLKCIKRYKLFDKLIITGSLWDKEHIHRYAKCGVRNMHCARCSINAHDAKMSARIAYDIAEMDERVRVSL